MFRFLCLRLIVVPDTSRSAMQRFPRCLFPIPSRDAGWHWFRLAILLSGLIAPNLSHAEFIQPVAVTVSNGEDLQDALINGTGFDDPGLGTPESVHTTAASEMWTAVGSIRAEVVFDLGKTVDLTKVFIWNYNAANDTDRGMRDVLVFVSADSNPATAKFTGIANVSLAEGGTTAQAFSVQGTDVRLVKLKNTSNWGNGYAIGLAEVRFESGAVPGKVPFVTITGLKDGDTIPFGSDFSLAATVTDKDNNVSKVEFFDGTTKMGDTNKTPYTISLKSLAKGDHTLRVVATDALGLSAFAVVNAAVREVVPGKIIQIDDNRDIGTDVNQIRYNGSWTLAPGNANDPRFLNNDHYNAASGAYFEVKFVGVKIDVYATVAGHHGTASAQVDGGTKYTLNYKTPQRIEQAFIWSSPLLPNREHILRITVLGTGVVTADRFDVTQSDTPSDERASVKKWDVSATQFSVELEDLGGSKVDTNSLVLRVDGNVVPVVTSKVGGLTTVTYNSPTAFAPGSQHPFKVEVKDILGNPVGTEALFVVPAPVFPLSGFGEPAANPGKWSVRQIWNAGRADAVVTAVAIANAAASAGFTGKRLDVQAPVINFNFTPSRGNGGLFPDDAPFPGETDDLSASDWVTIARAKVRIPRAGDWTIGVHSDDGFALRFAGHPFSSVSGLGQIDEDYPEYVSFAVGTGDSNTRAVLKDLPAGDYVIEFIHFQRTGGASAEIYAAEGAFEQDGDASWALIGASDGLELVADSVPLAPFSLGQLRYLGSSVTIDFDSPKPDGTHALLSSADLKSWSTVAGASFASIGGKGVRATVNNPIGDLKFYRVSVSP